MSIVLSCPNCATRYRADPQAIGATGRRVRCANCSHVWTAEADEPTQLDADGVEEEEGLGQGDVDALFGGGDDFGAEPDPEPAPEPAANPANDMAANDSAEQGDEVETKPHKAFRAKIDKQRKTASLVAAGGAWGGLVFVFALMMTTAWVFRVDVVSLWPRAASAYAAVGAEVNPYGFTLDELSIAREMEDGVPVLVIEGQVRNFDRRARSAPDLKAALLDAEGEPVMDWVVRLEGEEVRAGQAHAFRTVIAEPPRDAVEAEVTLAVVERDSAAEPG